MNYLFNCKILTILIHYVAFSFSLSPNISRCGSNNVYLCVYDLSCQPFNCKPGNNEVVGNYRWQLTRFNGSMVEGLPSTAEDMNKYGITSEGSLTVNKAILTDEGTYICTFESQGNVRLQEMSPYHCLVVISPGNYSAEFDDETVAVGDNVTLRLQTNYSIKGETTLFYPLEIIRIFKFSDSLEQIAFCNSAPRYFSTDTSSNCIPLDTHQIRQHNINVFNATSIDNVTLTFFNINVNFSGDYLIEFVAALPTDHTVISSLAFSTFTLSKVTSTLTARLEVTIPSSTMESSTNEPILSSTMESMTTSQYLIVPSTPMTTNTPGLQETSTTVTPTDPHNMLPVIVAITVPAAFFIIIVIGIIVLAVILVFYHLNHRFIKKLKVNGHDDMQSTAQQNDQFSLSNDLFSMEHKV